LEIDFNDWDAQKPEVLQRLIGALPRCRISQEPIDYPMNYEGNDRYTY
jgi:hypothetical protein